MKKNALICCLLTLTAAAFVSACRRPVEEPLELPGSMALLARGQSLVQGLAACGACHGETNTPSAPLVGGRTLVDRYGEVRAANITPSPEGIGGWTPLQLVTAIRRGVRPDGELLSQEVHRGYEWLSDDDTVAIISWLATARPSPAIVERRSVSFIERYSTGLFERAPEVRGYVPALNPRHSVAYGQYLVDSVARCGRCHTYEGGIIEGTLYLGGGRSFIIDGVEHAAPSITQSSANGIGLWSEDSIVRYLKSGLTPDGKMVAATCPVAFYKTATDQDLRAVARYLKTLPAE